MNPHVMAQLIRRIVPERFRPIGHLTRLVRRRTNCQVRCGPFAGMRYVESSVGSAYLPKLLGTYERELAGVVEEACRLRPGLIIDLGAAEGYYAVGLALRNAEARIVAFEQEEIGRTALRRMARLNHVSGRIEIHGRCEAADLQSRLIDGKRELDRVMVRPRLVVCDVEGDEHCLLDPVAVPALSTAFILTETHDFIRPGITEGLRGRFTPTHKIQCIRTVARSRADFPFHNPGTWLLPKSYLDWAVSEWRPAPMSWLWMKPCEGIATTT